MEKFNGLELEESIYRSWILDICSKLLIQPSDYVVTVFLFSLVSSFLGGGSVPRLPRERRKRCKTLGFDLIFFFGWLGWYLACQGRGEQCAKQSDRCCAAKTEFSIHYLVFDLIFLLQELAKLSQKFGENVLDATKKFEKLITDKKDIEGLPATSLGLAAQTAVSTVRQKLSSCIFDN